jgi:hypothetical protein
MRILERALLGVVAGAIPGALAAVFFGPSVPDNFVSVLAIPLAVMLLCAALAILRVQPFPWLENWLEKENPP